MTPYTASSYRAALVVRTYIAFDHCKAVRVYECDVNNMTLRSYYGDPKDYPADKVEAARLIYRSWPNQVQVSGPEFKLEYRNGKRVMK